MSINYEKWNLIGLADNECDDPVFCDNVKDYEQHFRANIAAKLHADDLFALAEKSGDEYDYKVALNDGYSHIIRQLCSPNNASFAYKERELHALVTSCKLNAAVCCIKIGLSKEAVSYCNEVFDAYATELRPDQELRLKYLRAFASLHSPQRVNSAALESDIDDIKRILILHPQFPEGQAGHEYEQLFRLHDLNQSRRNFDDISAVENTSNETPSIGINNYRDSHENAVVATDGWEFLHCSEYQNAVDWFTHEIQGISTPIAKDDAQQGNINQKQYYDLYSGKGTALAALGDDTNVSSVFGYTV
jgi:hypothetical protein